MTAIALVSAKGSPGVTTMGLVLAAVWPQVHPGRAVLLAGCDPAGDDVGGGYLRGALDGSRGVLALAACHGVDPVEAVWGQLLALDEVGHRLLLPGLPDASRSAAVASGWSTLAAAIDGLSGLDPPVDVLLDLGRLGSAHDPGALRRRADVTVLVTRSSLPAVVAARAGAALLRDGVDTARLGTIVVAPRRPYPAEEVAAAVGLPLFGVAPDDPAAAAVYAEGAPAGPRTARSPLLRAARAVAAALLIAPDHPGPAAAPAAPVGVGRG